MTVSIANASCASSATNPCPIGVGANWQLSATVGGAANQNVTWSISPLGATSGTIGSGTGIYIAPNQVPNPPTITITATSIADGSATASVPVTVVANDPIGSVASYTQFPGPQSCPASSFDYGSNYGGQGTCIQLAVSCPLVADFSAYLKVNTPGVAPAGTVLFGTGTGGSGLYDDATGGGYQDGSNVVASLLGRGYNTVQVSFGAPFDSGSTPRGWLTGPGGVRRLACRYATVADWVYNHPIIINSSNASASNSAPMCATGNSGGSAAIAYAVYEYGLASEFAMIEPTSGPVMSRVDQGCSPTCASAQGPICSGSSNVATMCYESADAQIIDEAYQSAGTSTPTPCQDSIAGNPATGAAALFLSDSILYEPGQTVNLSGTIVKQLFGDADTSNAVPEGLTWSLAISPSSNPEYQCLASPVAHDIPSYSAGATQIASDIAAACH